MVTCPFCTRKPVAVLGGVYVVIRDMYPVTPGHILVVDQRAHSMTAAGIGSMLNAAGDYAATLGGEFNIGINWGVAAGQTIAHPHVHVIPRVAGDCENPTGGVRNVIAGRGKY